MSDDQPEVKTTGLFCFLNEARECSSECVAFTTLPSESPQLSLQQKHCTLIVGVERLGRFAGNVAQHMRTKQQDEARAAGASNIPGVPTPGKKP